MATTPGNGSRGGFSNALLTGNIMADGKPQPSLTQNLRLGTMLAHRGRCMDDRTGDIRNFRRANPMGNKARVDGT